MTVFFPIRAQTQFPVENTGWLYEQLRANIDDVNLDDSKVIVLCQSGDTKL